MEILVRKLESTSGAPLPNGSSVSAFFVPCLSSLFACFVLAVVLFILDLFSRCCRETFVAAQRNFEVQHPNHQKGEALDQKSAEDIRHVM